MENKGGGEGKQGLIRLGTIKGLWKRYRDGYILLVCYMNSFSLYASV